VIFSSSEGGKSPLPKWMGSYGGIAPLIRYWSWKRCGDTKWRSGTRETYMYVRLGNVNRNCHNGSFHRKVRGRRPPPSPPHYTPDTSDMTASKIIIIAIPIAYSCAHSNLSLAISPQLFHSKLQTLLFSKSYPDASSSPYLPPRLNSKHHPP